MKPSIALWSAALLTAAVTAQAADPAVQYPERPIRLVVPFPPGGSNDIMARYLGHYLTQRFEKQVVIDNRPGADAIIGTDIVAHSQADGYTLLIVSAAYSVNAAYRKLPYDSQKAFTWPGMLGFGPSVVSTGPLLKVASLRELTAHGKANPGKLTLSTSGGYARFAAELFNHMSGMKMLLVIYKGGFPALTDVMGGQTHVNLGSVIQTLPHLKSGKLTPLATSGKKRSAALPDLPTIAEAGVPGYEAYNTWAIAAPAGTPRGIVSKLNAEILRYLALPETQKRFASEGAEAVPLSPADTRKAMLDDIAKWAKVAKLANIRAQ